VESSNDPESPKQDRGAYIDIVIIQPHDAAEGRRAGQGCEDVVS